jgi:hypothetical protein
MLSMLQTKYEQDAIGICPASYVDCLQTVNITSVTDTYCCVYSVETLTMDSRSV